MAAPGATVIYRLFVGIDVSATTFTVALIRPGQRPSRAFTLDQTPAGFAELQRRLRKEESDASAILIVMEATGTVLDDACNHLGRGQFCRVRH
jgi:transposase